MAGEAVARRLRLDAAEPNWKALLRHRRLEKTYSSILFKFKFGMGVERYFYRPNHSASPSLHSLFRFSTCDNRSGIKLV